jgi:methionyl-tRNA synthetase
MVSLEDFQKIDLRVAKILQAERVKNSQKLIKLQVDLGEKKKELLLLVLVKNMSLKN